MTIGVPREIKNNEHRVVMVPAGVRTLVERGHRVLVEKSAGEGSGIPDEEYRLTGAEVMESAGEAEMVIKVKEPIHAE